LVPQALPDANGNTSTITRPWTLNKETDCDGANNCTVLNLDGAGKKTDYTDKRYIKTTISYNGLQEATQANVNASGVGGYDQRTMGFSYDSLDRLIQLVDTDTGGNSQTNTINTTYDGVNNVLSEGVTVGNNSQTSIGYNYDADSRRTSASITGSGSNQAYSYSYDLDGELTALSSTGGAPLSATIQCDEDGRRSSLTVGSVITSYGYDADSELTSLSFNNSLGDLGYSYDNDGRMTAETGSLASLALPQPEGPNTYSSTNQILTWNGQSATMDSASNLTMDPTTGATLTWDSRNELSSVTGDPAGSFTASYDGILRRDSQTIAYGGTTTYLHDQKNVAQSASGGTGPVYNYLTVPGTGEVLAFSSTLNGTTSVYVPLHDRLGSTIGLVNSSNSLQTQYTYEPYGNVTASGTVSSYPYLFARMELDSSGYYHTQTRYYSPVFGRFLSADAGLPPNGFIYADDDPVNAIDPSGRSPEYVSGADSLSSASGNAPLWGSAADSSGDGLAGAVLAQSCPNGDCPNTQSIVINLNGWPARGKLNDAVRA
jgi:RHS repeat-associated protein